MTQQGLADRLGQLGARFDRTAVAKVEAGRRELTLMEAFQFALALHVAPVHLFTPPDDDDPIWIGPLSEWSPDDVRAWIRGDYPMLSAEREYFTTVPDSEFDAGMEKLLAWRRRGGISVRTSEEES